MTKPKLSLTEFAKANPPHRTGVPWMEANLPADVLEQCREGWKAGLRSTTLERWLKSEGYAEATASRIASYFVARRVE